MKIVKIVLITTATVAVLDQATKAVVTATLALHESIRVIPGLFSIVYVRNPGFAFGMGSDGGAAITVFLIGVTLAALVVIGILIRQAEDRLTVFALSLIAGGACGNLIDRVRFGEVVDFLDLYLGSYHWPAFNVADSAITVGVVLSIVLLYARGETDRGARG